MDQHSYQHDQRHNEAELKLESEERHEPTGHGRPHIGSEDDSESGGKGEQSGTGESGGRDGRDARRLDEYCGCGTGKRARERAAREMPKGLYVLPRRPGPGVPGEG